MSALAYVVAPASWSASMFFSRALSIPDLLAFVVDFAVWMVIAVMTIVRVLPNIESSIDTSRLR